MSSPRAWRQASRVVPSYAPPLPRAKLVREHENAAASLEANEVAIARSLAQGGHLPIRNSFSVILHFNLV